MTEAIVLSVSVLLQLAAAGGTLAVTIREQVSSLWGGAVIELPAGE